MKRSTIAAISGAVAVASGGALYFYFAPPEPPGGAPPGATASDASSDASRPSSMARVAAVTADGGTGATYLNYPDAWKKDATKLQQFFHLSEGSEVFPYGALLAIDSADNTPFFDPNNPSFGLLAEPQDKTCDQSQQWCNIYGMPVGMTVAVTRDTALFDMKMTGFNCAACHVGELQAGGTAYRVLGGPNMFNAIGFVVGLKNAVSYTMGYWVNVVTFLARWAMEGDNAIGATNSQFLALVQAAPAEIQSRSALGQALGTALQQTFNQFPFSKTFFAPRGPGLHLGEVVPAPGPQPTLKPKPIPPGSRPGLPPGMAAFTLPPIRPTLSSVASFPKAQLTMWNQAFAPALVHTTDGGAQTLTPFEAILVNLSLTDQLHILDAFMIDYGEAVALLEERFSALSALAAGGNVNVDSTTPGPGRVDAFMTARNILFPASPAPATSPVDIPRIWNLLSIPWYHWDGNTNSLIERNIGQAVVIGAVIDPANYQSTLRIMDIKHLEELAGAIPPPPWPSEVDAGAGDGGVVARGAKVFIDNCAHCHGSGNDAGTSLPEVKTDELRIRNFSLPMDGGGQFNLALKAELDAIMVQAYGYAEAGADAQEDPNRTVIQAPQQYANRSLEGVWSTAPYLHNGSVVSLADLLQPASARSSVVTVGGRVYDMDRVGYAGDAGGYSRDGGAAGDSICGHGYDAGCGHNYGTDLSSDDKNALLVYLKSL